MHLNTHLFRHCCVVGLRSAPVRAKRASTGRSAPVGDARIAALLRLALTKNLGIYMHYDL